MTIETPEIPDTSRASTQSRLKSELEHEYRFEKGEVIADRYQVIRHLGVGGFAEVYHCQDLVIDTRTVTVKVLTEKRGQLEEAKAAGGLSHSHIVTVHDVFTLKDQTTIILFEYIEGITLEEYLTQATYRRLALNESVLEIISQIAEALDYAHNQNVIHRDVKPSNIIIGADKKVYLTDFGLAEVKQSPERESALSDDLRQMGGTIPYMAPEQIKGETLGDRSSDLYSFGVTVYEMLTGQLPYYKGREIQIILQIASEETPPLPPRVANPELPQGIEGVLLRMLSKKPAERYPSAAAFVEELKRVSGAYARASTLYEQAMEYVNSQEWRQALLAFEQLETRAPGHKETKLQLEQVRQKVRLLDLRDEAEDYLKQERYQEALSTLEILQKIDPEYDVVQLRSEAINGREREERRSLQEQYHQARQQFHAGDYQAALDTLATIHQRDPEYADTDDIAVQAEKEVEYQKQLRQLYNQGVEHSRQEQWQEALESFQELNSRHPNYEDVELRLSTASHFYELSSLLEQARQALKAKQFATTIDLLDGIKNKNKNYKAGDVAHLRQESLDGLYQQAHTLASEREFSSSLAALAALQQRQPEYPGLTELKQEVAEGVRLQELQQKLDELYGQAITRLEEKNYSGVLELWSQIQATKDDVSYTDTKAVAQRAKEQLYNNAVEALATWKPAIAQKNWQQLQTFDPDFPDYKRVGMRIERQQRGRRLFLIAVLIAILFLGGTVVFSAVSGEEPPPASPTLSLADVTATDEAIMIAQANSTPTSSPTQIPSATTQVVATSKVFDMSTATSSATPTQTPTPTLTQTPTSTPTQTPTSTPTMTSLPEPAPDDPGESATANQPATIFAAPEVSSQHLANVDPGTEVVLLGRSANSSWLYIGTAENVEGFVAANRFDWDGDIDSLPVATPSASFYQGNSVSSSAPPTGLTLDIWPLPGLERCQGSTWVQTIFIEGHGGSGTYTYFWNGEKVGGPTNTSVSFEVSHNGGGTSGTGRVTSSDGQSREKVLFLANVDCG